MSPSNAVPSKLSLHNGFGSEGGGEGLSHW